MMEFRLLEEKDIAQACALTSDCFYDSTFYKYLCPDDSIRREVLYQLFTDRMKDNLNIAEIYVAEENGKIIACATWIPPAVDSVAHAPVNMSSPYPYMPDDVRERWISFIKILIPTRDRCVASPFWSLSPIVVAQEAQGKGIASKMIREMLAKIDEQNIPCFLAAQNTTNVAIYEKYGFEVLSSDELYGSGIISYTMVRPAQGK